MTASFEEKYHNFAQYLRGRQTKFYPMEMLNDIPDEEILESYRKNNENDEYFYTKDQEKSIIMEYESNESILEALENLQHLNHKESLEKEILEEFKSTITPILVEGYEGLNTVLSKLNNVGIKIEIEALNNTLVEAVSIFPYWVLNENEFYVREEPPHNFFMDSDYYCSICLLNKTLHKYKTLLGWSRFTYTSEFDEENNIPEIFQEKIIDFLQWNILSLVSKNSSGVDPAKSIENPKLINLLEKLMKVLLCYIMGVPLISCWVYGKQRALEEEKKNEEADEVLEQTHNYFHEKYVNCQKTGDMKQFFTHIDNFLKPLSMEQLKILHEEGFPLENLSTKTLLKINRTIIKFMKIIEEGLGNEKTNSI